MNKTIKRVLLSIEEVILATALWSLLDFIIDDSVDIINNLIDVTIIGLFCIVVDYFAKKKKQKNSYLKD